jgi:glycosyltransferase involved in cell wall biosynthesis
MDDPAQSWPKDFWVLIAAYRAADGLRGLVPALVERVPRRQVLVVDDGSGDDTGDAARQAGVELITHPVNRGKGVALRSGFASLLDRGASWIITMDADGQHAPADLPRFVEEIAAHPDCAMVMGHRRMRPGVMPLDRICSNLLTSTILSILTRQPVPDSQCGYRAYSARLLRHIETVTDRFEMESEVILRASWAGYRLRSVRVQTLYSHDLSHISHLKDTLRWVRAVASMVADAIRRTGGRGGPRTVRR